MPMSPSTLNQICDEEFGETLKRQFCYEIIIIGRKDGKKDREEWTG